WRGWTAKAAAETCGMDRQMLPDRVHRHNADGLADFRTIGARRGGVDPGQIVQLVFWLEAGPRSGGGRGRVLAAAGAARPGCRAPWGETARTDGRQGPGGARLPAAVGAPAASENRSRGPGEL